MTILTVQTPGSDEQLTLTKAPPFSHFIQSRPINHCYCLAAPTSQETDTVLSAIETSQIGKCVACLGATKSNMSPLWKRSSKKPATILRAVPETTPCDTALHSDERDLTTQAYALSSHSIQPGPSSRSTSSLPEAEACKGKIHSGETCASTNTQYCPVSDSKVALSNTSLKGAIGTYKHGRIQWRQKDRKSSASDYKHGQSADRSSRPKIQVVIPTGTRDRPLPTIPFFGNHSRVHIQATFAEAERAHDVSPPSASNRIIMRDSIVSPLSQSQSQPVPFGQFQRSVSRSAPKPTSFVAKQYKSISRLSNSSNDSQESDASSVYSNRSSETSVEAEPTPLQDKTVKHPTSVFSIHNPTVAGASAAAGDNTLHRIPPSSVPPRRYAHHAPTEQNSTFQPTCEIQPARWNMSSLTWKPTLTRKSSKRNTRRRSLASNSSMGVINEAISRSTSRQLSSTLRGASPTLSEAENDLQEQLTSFTEDKTSSAPTDEAEQAWTSPTEDKPFKWDDVIVHNDSVTAEPLNAPPPAVPRKSSKRQSAAKSKPFRLSHVPRNHIASQLTRGRSRRSQGLTLTIPEYKRMTEEFVLTPIEISPPVAKRTITPSSAEIVILNIFRSLDHLEDLFATAVVNRGFYRVFKRHELELIKSTLRKMSPPAWEFRELAFPGHDLLHAEDLEMTRPEEEYTPSTYLQLQKRDIQTVRAVKSQIKEQCQSFVRPEISMALLSEDPIESARVDNALWRIWTFCKIFGSGKGREEDIVAQMDWLKGGLLVHQPTCTFSIMSTDYMNDTLVGAPECFAKGNEGGLTAEQLFDMMELWNCLGVLLQGFEGRTAQARKAGIYDNTDVRGGDIDGEETMLDEWCYYLLTFGLSTVLDLGSLCRQPDCFPFKLASEKGWANWRPPVFGGTRRNFLKEAASRVYEDKIAHTYAATSTRDVQRQQSKIRIQKHISELRQRKNSNERTPLISMSQERPMSDWDTVIGNLTRPRPAPASRSDIVSYIPTLRSALAQELSASIAELPADQTSPPSTRSSSPRRVIAQPLLPTPPPSTVPSNRDRNSIAMSMPSIEEHPAYRKDENIPEVPSLAGHPAFRNGAMVCPPLPANHHSRQSSDSSVNSQGASPAFLQHQRQKNIYGSESYENTADKAIYRIVEMGFTADQAREALRMTDLGNGLRVDRAVELLLSRHM